MKPDYAEILTDLFPDLPGWSVVEKEGKVTIHWPEAAPIPKPTLAELDKRWPEVLAKREHERIAQEREARYREETDGILFDALAKLAEREPDLQVWKQAREAIKKEIPYESEEKK